MANQDKRQARDGNRAKGGQSKGGPPKGSPAKGGPTDGSTGKGAPPPEPSRAERRAGTAAERRRERLKAPERQQRQRSMGRIGLAAVVVLVLAGIGFGIYSFANRAQPPEGVQTFANLARDHVETPVTYEEIPPVGGVHSAVWQNCGFYDKPVGNEHGVHSMEHGAVWITYQPDLSADQVDILREQAQQSYVLVSPYTDLPSPVVVSAWGNQLQLDSATDSRLDQFVKYFREGPQTPEPGAPCNDGTSATV